MISKVSFLAGAAVGYVVGARAGREQYDKIKDAARQASESPVVQQAKTKVETVAGDVLHEAKEKIAVVPGGPQDAEQPAVLREPTI